ncbi:MAG: biotin/lipoyl-containing protein [Candidatus Omnitrophota bacterium]
MLFKLPEVSSRQEVVITEWYKGLNSTVKKGQDLVEVSSDKATFDLSSPCDGVLVKILKKKGESVVTGEFLAEISESGKIKDRT